MADKASFLRLPINVDIDRLRRDVESIQSTEWKPSHWAYPHGSVEMIVLRGGDTNTEADFLTTEVTDRHLLAGLTYLSELVGPSGPFGGAHFAFLFRMAPNGQAKLHRDAVPIWHTMYRVHVPVATHPQARLVVAGRRGQHFAVGEAWTFDNQALHGFVNGPTPRTHLIMDVPAAHPAMAALRAGAELVLGQPVSDTDWTRLT